MSIIEANLKGHQSTYVIDVETLKRLVAKDLGVPASQVDLGFTIGDLHPPIPGDSYDPPRGVVAIEVTVTS